MEGKARRRDDLKGAKWLAQSYRQTCESQQLEIEGLVKRIRQLEEQRVSTSVVVARNAAPRRATGCLSRLLS